jgi:cation transport ATPase
MKNAIKLSVILSTIVLFLSSCSTNLTVMKRQHSKGYYVSYNKNHSRTATPNKLVNTKKEVDEKSIEFEHTNENTTASTQSTFDNIKPNTFASNLENTLSTSNEKVDVAEETQIETTSKSNNNFKHNLSDDTRTIKPTKKNIKTLISKNSEKNDRNLSLLWVVIIVLLVLWALGLIGGFGAGLIHLLLVIALILLILWLLRVI